MKILFHICCSNCALYPVKLSRSEGNEFTGLWYNPNIHPLEEYNLRLDSLKKLSDTWRVEVIYNEEYKPEEYFEIIKSPLSPLLQRGEYLTPTLASPPDRCKYCYELRLEKTAATAKKEGFEAFSTTLLISPYQDFRQIETTGRQLAEKYNVLFYLKDFRPYFREAQHLAKELGLYRQKYCGCIFSRQERAEKQKE